MIDSHTHLDSTPGADAEIIAAARAAGVTRVLTIGTDAASSCSAQAAAEAHAEVWFAVGHHPNNATGYTDTHTDELRELARHPRCAAIGETGLDDFRDYAPRSDQERAFAAHIDLAHELQKPLVIHSRAAEDDTIATLARDAQGLQVILHCFSMPSRLDECLAHGWWISFAGNVTYPNARELADAAERTPLDRMLVETDAPYLAPQAVRSRRAQRTSSAGTGTQRTSSAGTGTQRTSSAGTGTQRTSSAGTGNQPAYVVHTAQFLAERQGIPYAELEAAMHTNSSRLLGW